MPYRTHVLPQRHLTHHRVRVTMQQYDFPLEHDVVRLARRTPVVRALLRRHEPIRIVRAWEVRRDGEVIGVVLEPHDRLPNHRRRALFAICVSGEQPCCHTDLYWSTSDLYWAAWRGDQAALEAQERKAQREAPPVPAEERLARRRDGYRDAKALAALTFI